MAQSLRFLRSVGMLEAMVVRAIELCMVTISVVILIYKVIVRLPCSIVMGHCLICVAQLVKSFKALSLKSVKETWLQESRKQREKLLLCASNRDNSQ